MPAIDVEALIDKKIEALPDWVKCLIDEDDRNYYRKRLRPREDDDE